MTWEMLAMLGLGLSIGLLCWVYYMLYQTSKSIDRLKKKLDQTNSQIDQAKTGSV